MEEKKIIKEELMGVGYKKLPSFPVLTPQVTDFILAFKEIGLSLNAIRIVLILSANLKEKQMKFRGKDKEHQLSLFDDEWMSVENDTSYSLQLKFKIKDFLQEGNNNYKPIYEALNELTEKSYLVKFDRIDKNGKVRKFKLKSALISSYLMEEGNGYGIKMTINNYWYRVLIDVSKSFNHFSKEIIFGLNERALNFYIYLKTLPDIAKHTTEEEKEIYEEVKRIIGLHEWLPKGTRIRKDTFRDKFQINAKYDSQIKRDYLDVWRSELNKTDLSFGYHIDEKYITIVTYKPTKIAIDKKLMNVDEAKIKKAIAYRVQKHQLSNVNAVMLLELYLKYTYDVVFNALGKNRELKKHQGSDFTIYATHIVAEYVKANRIDIETVKYENAGAMRSNIAKLYPIE